MKSNKIFSIALSVFVSFVFVFAVTFAASTISTNISTGGTLTVSDTSTLTGAVTMSSTLGVTGLATLSGGATTTSIRLLNGEVISNATDGVVQIDGIASSTSITLLNGETITNATDGTITLTAATTSFSGLGLLANGFLSQASSTVVGNLTVTGTFSPTQTAATSFLVGGGYGDTGITLSAAGAISADGLATLAGGATTTTLTLLNGEIISNATDGVIQLGGVASTTSITLLNGETITNATDGTIQLSGIASTTSLTLLNGETITNATDGTITLTAATTTLVGTASTSAIKVGDEPNTPIINGMVFGYCSFADVTTFTASTTKYADCTTTPTGALLAGDRVFVQATSSFDSMFVITAASTTGVSTINLRILNTGLDGVADPTLGGTSINFWAVR